MGRKAKYTVEQKVKACENYLSGRKSANRIANELCMGKRGCCRVREWSQSYKTNGPSIFMNEGRNRSYSKELKEIVVKEYLNGGSIADIAAKYSIPKAYTVSVWVKKYNKGIELKDYRPSPEAYMANTFKTTLEERIEIVKYCLEHNRDIKGTAAHYGGNYAQIYQWVKKYEKSGEEGLTDRRGKRKEEAELTDLEKANRRIKQLERDKALMEMELEVLKKAEALGMNYSADLPRAKQIHLKKLHRIEEYQIIKSLHEEKNWDIEYMCIKLKIKRSSYYKWLKSSPSLKMMEKIREDEKILERIKEIAESNNSLFGAMNMYYTIRNEGKIKCGHNRVYRLMCINDIKSSYRRTSSYTYIRSTPEQTTENTLKREFSTDKPNKKWCTDVTEIRVSKTGEKLFISPMIDLYDRYPVSLVVSERNDAILANETLDKAHRAYPDATPLVHSDRGFAYTRNVYRNKLNEYGMTQSMSRVSRCIDNGVCEGFQGQFKDILFILYPNIESKEEMIRAIYGTLDYYINHYPQKRLKGKTCGQVRSEAMTSIKLDKTIENYPIKQANRYIRFWADISEKQQRLSERIAA